MPPYAAFADILMNLKGLRQTFLCHLRELTVHLLIDPWDLWRRSRVGDHSHSSVNEQLSGAAIVGGARRASQRKGCGTLPGERWESGLVQEAEVQRCQRCEVLDPYRRQGEQIKSAAQLTTEPSGLGLGQPWGRGPSWSTTGHRFM